MAKITWSQPGTSGNWNSTANWKGGVLPGSSDTAVLPPGSTLGGGYTVTIGGSTTNSFSLNNLNLQYGVNTLNLPLNEPQLDIASGGSLTVKTIGYSAPSTAASLSFAPLLIDDAGLLKITNTINLTNIGSQVSAETISVEGTSASNAGTLEFGSSYTDNPAIAYGFDDAASGKSHGTIQFDASQPTNLSERIVNVAWGDRFVFTKAGFDTTDHVVYNAATGTLQVENASGTTLMTMSNVFVAPGTTGFTITADGGTKYEIDAVCFAAGTRILTERGEVAVEDLAEGERVVVVSGESRALLPIRWIGHSRINLARHPRPENAAPIRIRRGAFAENVPARDLLVSPEHCILADGHLFPAKLLVNGGTITQEAVPVVEYFHVETERHAIILAEGLAAETYLDTGNRAAFDNAGAARLLHPEFHVNAHLKAWETDAAAPLARDLALRERVWRRLAERAAALGHAAPAVATTSEPDLVLAVGAKRLRPLFADERLAIFALPRGVGSARLCSRATRPVDLRPWQDDPRRLGVSVARLVLRNAEEVVEIAIDDPALGTGWHAVERDGASLSRWTDGAASLDLPALATPVMLEVQFRHRAEYALEAPDEAPGEIRVA
jgi:hypothetical protein